ncbi:MAG: hypothetical protein ACJ8F1_15970 [Polyangia bacterium]
MRAHHGTLGLLVAAAVTTVAVGCSNDLPVASHLERTRLIGARVSVAADPGRAEVLPGESAVVEWIVAGPRPPATLDWAFAVCRAGQGACVDETALAGTGSGTPIRVGFQAPVAGALTDGVSPVMFGEVCANGALGFDASGTRATCSGTEASGTDARFVVPVRLDGGTPNRQPILTNDRLELDGAAWEPAGNTLAAGDPCDDASGLPVVVAPLSGDVKHPVRLISDGDDRETYTPAGASAPVVEELQFSNFATDGKFEVSYGAIPTSDTRPDADVTMNWIPPVRRDVPAAGEVVTLTFVVRDLRGGLDLTTRSLCLRSQP